MKKFNFLKTLLVLIGVLITSLTTQVLAGGGYYSRYINGTNETWGVNFYFNGNGDSWWKVNATTADMADWSADPLYNLTLRGYYVHVYSDVNNGISQSKMYYRFYKDGDTPPSYSETTSAGWVSNDGGDNGNGWWSNSQHQTWELTNANINLFNNVRTGGTYYFNFYVNTDQAGYLNNGCNSCYFAMKFTVPNRVFACDYGDNTWSATARQLTDGKYILENVAGNTTINFKLPFYSNWSSYVFDWSAVGANTKLGNTTIKSGDDNRIQFTTPSGYASNVLVTFTGSTVKVDCYPRYNVSVSAGENGHVSTSSVSNIDAGAVSSGEITAIADGGYFFTHWTLPDGVTAAEGYTYKSNPIKIHASASGKTITANFATKWAIKGGNSDVSDGADAMGDWSRYFNMEETSSGNGVFEGSVPSLAANTTYQFKIVDTENDVYYGYGDGAYCLSYVGQSGDNGYDVAGNKNNLRIMSAGDGTYKIRFDYSDEDHPRVKVTFPTVTHPSTDYIYFRHTQGWKHDSYVVLSHVFGGTQSHGERMMAIDSIQFDGKWYYYTALGDNTKAIFAGSQNTTTYKTEDLTGLGSDGTKRGKYYDVTSGASEAARWQPFTATLTLDHQGPSNAPAPNSVTVSPNASTNINTDIISTSPAKGGYYTFGGYYTREGGEGTQIIGTDEKIPSNLADYTSGGNWIKKGESVSATLYAKWTQSVKLHDNNGDVHSGSVTATYNASSVGSITAPTRDGHSVEGYYAEPGCTNKVMEADGTLVDYTGYVVGGKWIHDDASTLYAKWTEITHTVNVAAGANGSISGSVSSVSGVGIATASSSITAVPDDGYDFASWTLPTGVTAAEGYTAASNPIRINATEDGKTITANFTAHTYNISLEAGDHGEADGSATVVFNTSSLATVSHVSANAGYEVEGYYADETKVLNADGSFAADDVSGYITDGKWSKYDDDATLTAKFSPVTLYFNVEEGAYWNNAAKWTPNCVPTIDHPVVLEKKVQVNVNSAQAKSVRIHHYGDYTGMLVVKETAGLLVAEDIKAKHAAEGAYEGTTDEDLQIRTSDLGNGGLITGNACAGNEAEYEFYVKACKYTYEAHSWYINQYVGIPFASMDAYELYGFNIFIYDDSEDDWRTPGSATMAPWTAYNLISKFTNDWPYYFIKGELNLPGKSGKQTLTCGTRVATEGEDEEHPYFNNGGDHMFANSWTAPISIANMDATDFSDLNKDGNPDIIQTIYIFNAGFDGANTKTLGDYAGTWSSFPIGASAYMSHAVIPATQAFLVSSIVSNATMTLDYEKHVYNPAYDPVEKTSEINTDPTRAPRRVQANDDPNVLRIVVRSSDVDADQLYILERSDFSFGFDDSWDGNKIFGLSFAPQIYAVNEGNQMAVNAIPDMEGMKIGFKAGKDVNEYTLSFEYADDVETLYLYDTDTQAYTQITNEATYSFTTSDTKEHERFVITRKAPQIVTGIEETIIKTNARKQMIDGTLYIIRDGRMYNAEGALVK